jgi:alginate O-acetyltransferase complex protein AlgI
MFKLTDFSHVLAYLKAIGTNTHIAFKLGMDQISIIAYGLGVVLYHAFYLLKDKPFYPKFYLKLDTLMYGCMLFFIIVNSGSAGAFIYFQF